MHIYQNLAQYKKILVLAVGGGNDSVSTLLLQKQLQDTFQYFPSEIDIVAVLPDCLDYENLVSTEHPLINIITSNTTRSVQGYKMDAFPERILSQYKNIIPSLPIKNVYGISMAKGSVGIANALIHLIRNSSYDLIMAIDVGGDFIAVPENIEVLSPMMDGYMLYALKELKKYQQTVECSQQIPVLYSVFGLGTDGETTPLLLFKALNVLPHYYEGTFDKNTVQDVINFYRSIVEKNRYSRTADFTIKEIEGIVHDNPASFRGRFHVKQNLNEKSSIHYGVFQHIQDPIFFGKYYLFENIDNITNPFSIPCNNGLEWFLNVQNSSSKINHELNGQSYMNLGFIFDNLELNNISLFFGTPSRKFNEESQKLIIKEIQNSILNKIYNTAIIYKEYQHLLNENILKVSLNDDLILIGQDKQLLKKIISQL